MDDNLIPVLGIICLFGLPMVGWILGRMMKHRERMEMLRMGMIPPPDGRGWRNRDRFAAGPSVPPPWTSAQGPIRVRLVRLSSGAGGRRRGAGGGAGRLEKVIS